MRRLELAPPTPDLPFRFNYSIRSLNLIPSDVRLCGAVLFSFITAITNVVCFPIGDICRYVTLPQV